MSEKPDPKRPGPEPERLKIEGNWEEVAHRAINTKPPAKGWAKTKAKKKTKKK